MYVENCMSDDRRQSSGPVISGMCKGLDDIVANPLIVETGSSDNTTMLLIG